MAKVDVESSGTYIIIPRKLYKKWMKILKENPESDEFAFSIKGWHDVQIFPEDYKTGKQKEAPPFRGRSFALVEEE